MSDSDSDIPKDERNSDGSEAINDSEGEEGEEEEEEFEEFDKKMGVWVVKPDDDGRVKTLEALNKLFDHECMIPTENTDKENTDDQLEITDQITDSNNSKDDIFEYIKNNDRLPCIMHKLMLAIRPLCYQMNDLADDQLLHDCYSWEEKKRVPNPRYETDPPHSDLLYDWPKFELDANTIETAPGRLKVYHSHDGRIAYKSCFHWQNELFKKYSNQYTDHDLLVHTPPPLFSVNSYLHLAVQLDLDIETSYSVLFDKKRPRHAVTFEEKGHYDDMEDDLDEAEPDVFVNNTSAFPEDPFKLLADKNKREERGVKLKKKIEDSRRRSTKFVLGKTEDTVGSTVSDFRKTFLNSKQWLLSSINDNQKNEDEDVPEGEDANQGPQLIVESKAAPVNLLLETKRHTWQVYCIYIYTYIYIYIYIYICGRGT
eukprot:GHVL01039937.1.p1 GENE.GHVL01039937.1~~GHVL01039937.1.p1  ORF type:complete len:427 (+),score=105.75 GHVL01039937.1:29-1309(+)